VPAFRNQAAADILCLAAMAAVIWLFKKNAETALIRVPDKAHIPEPGNA